jgi:neutral amino acid transport system permease protein
MLRRLMSTAPRAASSKRIALTFCGVVLFLLLLASAAEAQESGGELIFGFVRNERVEDGDTIRDPVPGVDIRIIGPDGNEVGVATTDDTGRYELALPGPGDFTAEIDTDSFPDDVQLRSDAQRSVVVDVRPDERQILNYFLGADTRTVSGRWSLLPQTIANGLKFGLIIAIAAIGLSLIYGTTGLSNFAHGDVVTLGAIVTWYFNQTFGLHLLLAAPFGIAAAALASGSLEKFVIRPMRHRGIGLTSMMIVTIGIGIAARYIYQYYFGGRARPFRQYSVQSTIDLGPFSLTPRDMTTMAICLVTLVSVGLFLQRTRAGKAVRAVSDNPSLASASGINTERVILNVFLIGGALAGLGGVLLGLDQQVRWDMGFTLLLLMFAAITLGGLGNPFGALVGALIIGMMVELWTWFFPNVVELKTMGALLALIILLLVRPQGILGRKERVG